VTQRAKESEKIKESVSKVKDRAEQIVKQIGIEKAIAEEKLEAAKPALEEAEEALNTIKPANIATVRKLGRPPHLIMRVMDCVVILFRKKLSPMMPDPTVPSPKPSWNEALKIMARDRFYEYPFLSKTLRTFFHIFSPKYNKCIYIYQIVMDNTPGFLRYLKAIMVFIANLNLTKLDVSPVNYRRNRLIKSTPARRSSTSCSTSPRTRSTTRWSNSWSPTSPWRTTT
jgi:hypothetical protein